MQGSTRKIPATALEVHYLADAIRLVGINATARALGIRASAVFHWVHHGAPADRVLQLEVLLGLPRRRIRPDLYGKLKAGERKRLERLRREALLKRAKRRASAKAAE